MEERNQHLTALYLSKAESRSKWSFIGILVPIVGIILSIMSLFTVRRARSSTKDERKDARKIQITSIIGLTLSIIVLTFVLISCARYVSRFNQPEYLSEEDTIMIADNDSEYINLYGIGEEITFATQTMRVNSITATDTIQSGSYYVATTSAGDGAKFIVINITVTNTTKNTYRYEDFNLIDSTNRQYEAYDAIGYIDNYMDTRELAPSIPETGNAVYRVPTDANEFNFGDKKAGTGEFHYVYFKLEE